MRVKKLIYYKCLPIIVFMSSIVCGTFIGLGITADKRENSSVAAHTLPSKIKKQFVIGQNPEKTIELTVGREEYLQERNKWKTWKSQNDLNYYTILHKLTDELADKLSSLPDNYFAQTATGKPVQDYERVMQFMRNLTYQSDTGRGYAKHPLETIVEGGGDCEDSVILVAALLRRMGRKFAVLNQPGHVSLTIQLREGEEPPQYSIMYANTVLVPATINGRQVLQTIDLPIVLVQKPAMHIINDKKYFAIETTSKQPEYIKTEFAKDSTVVEIE